MVAMLEAPKGLFPTARSWRHRQVAFDVVCRHMHELQTMSEDGIQRVVQKVGQRDADLGKALGEEIRRFRALK
jgi:hypothetical protein